MLPEQIQRTIVQACVTVTKRGGRGVLVPGNLVLTAAHCISYTTDGAMVLRDYFIEELQTMDGPVKAQPLAVEPVTDIAVLGALDEQAFPEEADAFEAWCDRTPPVPVCLEPLPLFDPKRTPPVPVCLEPLPLFAPIYIYTHTGTWIHGSAQAVYEDAHQLWIEVSEPITGGTSGSPIVNDRGALVGIVSNTNAPNTTGSSHLKVYHGHTPRPHLTLPGWVMRRILAEQTP